jgi:hypothetical protein
MSRKVKVVAVENVELSSSKMKLISPTDELQENVDKLAQVDHLEKPPSEPEVTEPEVPPVVESPSSDQSLVVEAKMEVLEPPKETKTKKKDEKMTCPVCNKTMLTKTYKYTHQALCKPKEPAPSPPPKAPQSKPKKEAKPKTKEIPSVSFDDFKEMKELMPAPPPDYATQYRAAREQRQQIRTQRVKSLISQAI